MTIEKEAQTCLTGTYLPKLLSGKCKKADIEYKNGARYNGEVCGNKRSGQGLFTWPNGAHYDGEFVDNKRHGKGVQEWPDGSRYEGEFADDCRHGFGQHSWPSGELYVGSFYKDRRHGYGIYTWPDGSQYAGTFYIDKKEGYGTFTFANGSKFEGLYKSNEREGPGIATYSDGKRDVGLWHREHLVKMCKPVNGADFTLEAHGYASRPDEHRVKLSKSAAVTRRQEAVRSVVGFQTSPPPLNYEFEPDPEMVLKSVVSDLLPTASLAADIYAYDKAFFAAASNPQLQSPNINELDQNNPAENPGVLTTEKDKEILNGINNKIQENCRDTSAGKAGKSASRQNGGAKTGRKSKVSSTKSKQNGKDDEVDEVLAFNNTPSCIAMQTNVLRHRCGQSFVSFDVDALLCGKRPGDAGDCGPLEAASERLILAAGAGDLTTVRQIVETGEVSVDVADVRGRTALFAASVNCHQTVVNCLLDFGADVNKLDDEGVSALSACFVYLCPRDHFLDNAADGIFAKPVDPAPSTTVVPTSAKKTRAGKTRKITPSKEPSKVDSKRIQELRQEYGNAAKDQVKSVQLVVDHVEADANDCDNSILVEGKENIPNQGNGYSDTAPGYQVGTLSVHRSVRSSSVEELVNGGDTPTDRSTSLTADMTSKLSQFESHQTANGLPVKVTDRQIERCATILSTNEMIAGRARSGHNDVWSEGTVRRLALEKSKWQLIQSTTHLLLKRGANPNTSSVPMPVLFFAVKCGDIKTVRLLLDKGAKADTTLPDSMGRLAPLHFSCGLLCKEGIEITKLLLCALADPDARALEDDSFIDHFLEDEWKKDELTVENLQILGGRTPLHIACAREDNYQDACEVVRLLLSHNANTRVLCNGHSPLTLAITRGNDLAVEVLLNGGVDPNVHHSHGIGSALCAATFTANESRRHPDARIALIDRLVSAGANVLAPIGIGPRRQIGTVVDYANYVYNLDQRVGHVPYHALTVDERETFNARHRLLEHLGHLLRMQAVDEEHQRILQEEKSGKISRNPSASFVYTGHGARIESAMQQRRKKPTSAASSVGSCGSNAEIRRPLFRYCYECGRSVNVRLTACPRCKEVYYCSKPCQNKAWATVHKDECLRVPVEGQKSGRGASRGRGEHSTERDGRGVTGGEHGERGEQRAHHGQFGGRNAGGVGAVGTIRDGSMLQETAGGGAAGGPGVGEMNANSDQFQTTSGIFPMGSWKDDLPENCYIGNYSFI